MKANIIFSLGFLLVVGLGVFFVLSQQDEASDDAVPTATPAVTPMPTGSDEDLDAAPTATPGAQVPADWETYTNEELGLMLAHPPEIRVSETQREAINFQLWGPTQTEGTELFDGISLTVTTGSYETDTFREFVEREYLAAEEEPTTSDITSLQETGVAGKQGYSYVVTSLGEFTHVYIPLENDSYAHIYYLVADPEGQGFQDTLVMMLDSLSFNEG